MAPADSFFFFFPFASFGATSLCVSTFSYTYAPLWLLHPLTLFGLVKYTEWGIKVEMVLCRHKCFTRVDDQRWNKRILIHYSRCLFRKIREEEENLPSMKHGWRKTFSHITAPDAHIRTKWTASSLFIHSTVDHNKSFTQSCSKSCRDSYLCCVIESFTCVQFHNHMFVFMSQQCILWAIITVVRKIRAHTQ